MKDDSARWSPYRLLGSSIYRRSLMIILLVSCLPTAIMALSVYIFGASHVEREVTNYHQRIQRQSTERIDQTFSHLETTLVQWSFNPMFGDRLRTMVFKDQQYLDETKDLFQTLLVLKGLNPMIEEVYLFVHSQSALVSYDGGVRPLDSETNNKLFQSLLKSGKSFYWANGMPELTLKPFQHSLALVHTLPQGPFQPYGALIMVLKSDQVSRLIAGQEDGESSLVLSDSGVLIASGRKGNALTELDQQLLGEAVTRKADFRSFLMDWKNEKYSVSTAQMSRIGWKWNYVTATPVSKITQPVVILSRFIITVSVLSLIAAALLSLFVSQRMYRPIQQLVHLFKTGRHHTGSESEDEISFIRNRWQATLSESDRIETKHKQSLPHLRGVFMLQLVQGSLISATEEELLQRLQYFGWEMEQRACLLMLIKLQGFSNIIGRFQENDRQLVTFAAGNIIGELAARIYERHEVILLQDLTIGLILNVPIDQDSEELRTELRELSKDMESVLNSLLHLRCTIGIGIRCESVKGIALEYEDMLRALSYRNMDDASQIIDMETFQPPENAAFPYPFHLEKEIMHAIRSGDGDAAIRGIDFFLQELRESAGKEWMVQQGMLQLLGNLLYAMLQSGMNLHQLTEGANLYMELSQLHESAEMKAWFARRVVQPYMQLLTESHDLRSKKLVEQVLQLLQDKYMTELSLEACADMAGTNPVYLSKAFKQITGVNYIDYLTDLRLKKAQELLVDTTLKINDIAERVGYQPSYFNRIFKKHVGITAGEFRQKHQDFMKL